MRVWHRWVFTVEPGRCHLKPKSYGLGPSWHSTTNCSHRAEEAFYLAPSFRSSRSTPNTGTTIMKTVHMALAKPRHVVAAEHVAKTMTNSQTEIKE